ncbi:ABC transporter substrate-binding protein [Mameliella alba]|uniref:Glycine betaine/proline ABC transporter, periplasmic substrate-binding protein n=2 Tax=Mameliella alba TaxID=561184 RepID=A0A0B3RY87_9RHOB|nr:glycine betaine ABC transporter substrate-binding protein [Mameliella alba]KHQ51708.1 Glycine betaine/proline ABC transporter, periplasmic substrate-binding protein [Mameliella alba]GGF74748.1 amino acid-binding protein [Mameliella alba]
MASFGLIASVSTAMAADIVIGVQNWPSAAATSNIIKTVIEENLGLEVELQNGTNPVIFEAMDKGAIDIIAEVWMPNQQNLYDTYVDGKGTVELNANSVPASQGLCAPSYVATEMGVTSVQDLTDPDKAALFDTDGDGKGNLWVGNPGDASGNVEKIKAKSYGYDQTMTTDVYDEAVAYANLDAAIKANKAWVGFCYAPHYIFAVHDLIMLEEPAYDAANWTVVQPTDDPDWLAKSSVSSAWPTAQVHVGFRKALETENPEVAAMLRNITFTADEVSAMTQAVVIDKQDPETYAKDWVAAHQDAIVGWFTN